MEYLNYLKNGKIINFDSTEYYKENIINNIIFIAQQTEDDKMLYILKHDKTQQFRRMQAKIEHFTYICPVTRKERHLGILYSYETPILIHIDKLVIITDRKYSRTTSKQTAIYLRHINEYINKVIYFDTDEFKLVLDTLKISNDRGQL